MAGVGASTTQPGFAAGTFRSSSVYSATTEGVGQVDRLRAMRAPLAAFAGLAVASGAIYRLIARGQLTLDTGIGRTLRPLGPVDFTIRAPREIVFDVIATPYLDRTPRALRNELAVWERGSGMVLAAHLTEVKCGTTTTLETVRFERPARVDFRVVRGPIPHVIESFVLSNEHPGTRLRWEGELGTDFWAAGAWWGERVARQWECAVRRSMAAVTAEAERLAARGAGPAAT
jgi:hypothetical protein